MKLMTYNILGGWQDRMPLISETILAESPDFLVLNEANALLPDVFGHLKQLTASTALYSAAAAPSGQDTFHVLLLSKQPFRYVEFLPSLVRAGLFTVVDTEFGEIAVVGIHLTPFSEAERLREVSTILTALSQFEHVIIMGDFNALSPSDDYCHLTYETMNEIQRKKYLKDGKLQFSTISELLKKHFVDVAAETDSNGIHTAPTALKQDAAHANMRLDYVFVSESLAPFISAYRVVKNDNTGLASDHYPVVVELQKKAEGSAKTRKRMLDSMWFDFEWDPKKVWDLDVPVETMDVSTLAWHLDIPLWETGGKRKSLTPRQLLENPSLNPSEYKRITDADTRYPLNVMWWEERWMMLDGVHRLAKAVKQHETTVRIRKVPFSAIDTIKE